MNAKKKPDFNVDAFLATVKQPTDETRTRPDFDILAIQQSPGFGNNFLVGLANDLSSRSSDRIAGRQYVNAIFGHGAPVQAVAPPEPCPA